MRSTQKRKERLYGRRKVKESPPIVESAVNVDEVPKHKISRSDMREVERLIKKIDIKFNNGGDIKMLESTRAVERFMRKVIYPEFITEVGKKEARSFTIAVLASIGAIPVSIIKDLVRDENEDVYTKLALVYISNGRAESTYVENYEDIVDESIVRKTFDILSTFKSVKESMFYNTIKMMVNRLPSTEATEEVNPKNLPAIIETTYHSFNPSDPVVGKIARNDWYDLDKEFGDIVADLKYTFFKIVDPMLNLKTTVFRLYDATGMMILADRIIDNGSIIGLSTSLEVPVYVEGRLDSMFCNVRRHPDIIRWSLLNPQSAIPEEYRLEICKDMLNDPRIYYFIDFSCQSIDDLDEKDKATLNNNLTKIFNTLWNNNNMMYRMTLTEFANPNKFELLSDKETMCHKDSCRDIAPLETIIKFDNGTIEYIQNERSVNLSDVANGQSVYGPNMNGLFGGLIIH